MPGTGAYLLIGAIAAVVTFATTPVVGKVARRMGWVVEPDDRRVHTVSTPDVGGIAMFIGFIVAFAASRLMDVFDPLYANFSEPRHGEVAWIPRGCGPVAGIPRLAVVV